MEQLNIKRRPAEEDAKVRLARQMTPARQRTLDALKGIGFEDTTGSWVEVYKVDDRGAYVRMVGSEEPGAVVEPKDWARLITDVTTSARHKSADGWEFVVSGRGDLFVFDWPNIVLHTGWSLSDIMMMGVSHCWRNPKKTEEAWR